MHVFLCSPDGLSPCTALALRALAQRISEVCYRTSAWAVKRRLSKKPKETNKKKKNLLACVWVSIRICGNLCDRVVMKIITRLATIFIKVMINAIFLREIHLG